MQPSFEDDEEDVRAKMPSLAKPFAAFGAAAGLFVILGLGAFREPVREVSLFTPVIVTAIVGALVGVTLRRWKRLHAPMLAREAVVMRISFITALAGLVAGSTMGFVTWGVDGAVRFAGGGALVALIFVPSVLVVFDAARRAGRGRHGSLVASTDRRTVLSTVLGGIAFAGATQVPALLAAETSNDLAPLLQVLLSIVVCAVSMGMILVLERRDRKARVALEAFANDAAWLDRVVDADADTNAEAAAPGALDLGMGAEQWTRTTDANYRLSGKSDVLVKGSIVAATAAFDECAKRRHRSFIFAACALTAVSVSFALRLGVYL